MLQLKSTHEHRLDMPIFNVFLCHLVGRQINFWTGFLSKIRDIVTRVDCWLQRSTQWLKNLWFDWDQESFCMSHLHSLTFLIGQLPWASFTMNSNANRINMETVINSSMLLIRSRLPYLSLSYEFFNDFANSTTRNIFSLSSTILSLIAWSFKSQLKLGVSLVDLNAPQN